MVYLGAKEIMERRKKGRSTIQVGVLSQPPLRSARDSESQCRKHLSEMPNLVP